MTIQQASLRDRVRTLTLFGTRGVSGAGKEQVT